MNKDSLQQLNQWLLEQEQLQTVERDTKDMEQLQEKCNRILELIRLKKRQPSYPPPTSQEPS